MDERSDMVEDWQDKIESNTLPKIDVLPQHVSVLEKLGVIEGRHISDNELVQYKLCPAPTRNDHNTASKQAHLSKTKDPSDKRDGHPLLEDLYHGIITIS